MQQQSGSAPATGSATDQRHHGLGAGVMRLLHELPKLAVAGAVIIVAGASMLKVGRSPRACHINRWRPGQMAIQMFAKNAVQLDG